MAGTEKRRVVIAGGSGFLGRALARHLAEIGFDPVILTRSGGQDLPCQAVLWDGRNLGPWSVCLDGAAALVNFAGRSVDCRKTPENRDEILRSRVESTMVLGRALEKLHAPPPVWVQMSTAHIYGDPLRARCDESSALGMGFAPEIGRAWEEAFWESVPSKMRPVVLRTGFVLGAGGGALQRLSQLTGLGLGGRVGGGRQGMSWLHEQDLHRLVVRAIEMATMRGVYVASSPNPVGNQEFMATLGRVMGVPIALPAPAWLVRLAAPLVLNTDAELALYGRYCVSRRLPEEGFSFVFSNLEEALSDLLDKKPAVLGTSNDD